MRCCAGSVQYRSNPGNMSLKTMQIIPLPPGNTSYRSYRSGNRSAPKELDHEVGTDDLSEAGNSLTWECGGLTFSLPPEE